MTYIVKKFFSIAAMSNLVAIRHMWRQALEMWRQAKFHISYFHIFDNYEDCEPSVQ
jgi:hypothetical protein